MKPRQRVSQSGIELIKRFEGYRRSAAQLADGRWTVGYGHVKFAKDGVEVSEKDAEALLIYDLIEITGAVNDLTFTPLTQNQFDALTSFAFNLGVEAFKGSSVLRRINEGDPTRAAWAIEVWRRAEFEGASIVVDALIRRRAAEKALFLTPDAGFVPAPSPVLRPMVDYDAESKPPLETPVNLSLPLEGVVAGAYREVAVVSQAPVSQLTTTVESVTEQLRALVPDEPPLAAAFEAPAEEPVEDEAIQPFPADDEVVEAAPEASPVEPVITEAQPAPEASVSEDPAPTAIAEAAAPAATLKANGIRHFQRTPSKTKSLLPMIGVGAAGFIAFVFAVFWRLNQSAEGGDNAGDLAVSYLSGIFGVICLFAAASMALERFAGDDD